MGEAKVRHENLLIKKSEQPVRVDIACGNNKMPDFIGIDISKENTQADFSWDLEEFPWPIETGSVDEFACRHYIEHVKDIFRFMDEIYRCLKDGAKVTILAPYYSSVRCWQDPTHVRAISEMTFLYFNKEWRKINSLQHYPVSCDFDFNYGYNWDPMWGARSEEARAFAAKHYINVIQDIQVVLTKRAPSE